MIWISEASNPNLKRTRLNDTTLMRLYITKLSSQQDSFKDITDDSKFKDGTKPDL